MDIPDRRLSLLIICLIIFVTNPVFVKSPIIENTYSYINENTILAATPTFVPKLTTYGVFINEAETSPYIINKVKQIILCESSGRHDVWGDTHLENPVYGIAQFQERTFYWFAEMAGIKNPNWKDENQQAELLIWALENGYGNHWTCY